MMRVAQYEISVVARLAMLKAANQKAKGNHFTVASSANVFSYANAKQNFS